MHERYVLTEIGWSRYVNAEKPKVDNKRVEIITIIIDFSLNSFICVNIEKKIKRFRSIVFSSALSSFLRYLMLALFIMWITKWQKHHHYTWKWILNFQLCCCVSTNRFSINAVQNKNKHTWNTKYIDFSLYAICVAEIAC